MICEYYYLFSRTTIFEKNETSPCYVGVLPIQSTKQTTAVSNISHTGINKIKSKPKSTMFGFSLLSRVSLLAFISPKSSLTSLQVTRNMAQSTFLPAKNYLLTYEYVSDVLEKRGPYREGHLGLAKKMIEEGKCLSGGPTGEPNHEVPSGALFIFTDLESAQLYANEDPYVKNGIVTKFSIEEWNVVLQKE